MNPYRAIRRSLTVGLRALGILLTVALAALAGVSAVGNAWGVLIGPAITAAVLATTVAFCWGIGSAVWKLGRWWATKEATYAARPGRN